VARAPGPPGPAASGSSCSRAGKRLEPCDIPRSSRGHPLRRLWRIFLRAERYPPRRIEARLLPRTRCSQTEPAWSGHSCLRHLDGAQTPRPTPQCVNYFRWGRSSDGPQVSPSQKARLNRSIHATDGPSITATSLSLSHGQTQFARVTKYSLPAAQINLSNAVHIAGGVRVFAASAVDVHRIVDNCKSGR